MKGIVGRTAQVYLWRGCGADFVWHPGMSGLSRPSECCCGEHDKQIELMRLTPEQERQRGYERNEDA